MIEPPTLKPPALAKWEEVGAGADRAGALDLVRLGQIDIAGRGNSRRAGGDDPQNLGDPGGAERRAGEAAVDASIEVQHAAGAGDVDPAGGARQIRKKARLPERLMPVAASTTSVFAVSPLPVTEPVFEFSVACSR